MFNKKALVASVETSPYPGFTRAILTIGKVENTYSEVSDGEGNLVYYTDYTYGFSLGRLGDLSPSLGYTALSIYYMANRSLYFYNATRPFYCNGKFYSTSLNKDDTYTLFSYFASIYPASVEVYLKNV